MYFVSLFQYFEHLPPGRGLKNRRIEEFYLLNRDAGKYKRIQIFTFHVIYIYIYILISFLQDTTANRGSLFVLRKCSTNHTLTASKMLELTKTVTRNF
jgi:hypothetical protein